MDSADTDVPVAAEPATARSDPRQRACWLAGIAVAGTVLGTIAALDPTTIRPGWAPVFLALIIGSALVSLAAWRRGEGWSDRTIAGVVIVLDTLVFASIVANEDRRAALLNLILLLPPTLFAATFLRRPFPRVQEAVVVAGCGLVTATMAADPVQWLTMLLLPAAALVAAAETVQAQRRHLDGVLDSFEQLSMTDALTGLLNRRGIVTRLFAGPGDPPHRLTVLMLDIDHFKAINDRHGHGVGDDVLRAVGRGLIGETRSSDLVARLGGEEFVIVSWSSPEDTRLLAERLCRRAAEWMADWSATISIGGVSAELSRADGLTPERLAGLLDDADRCLYRAKQQGRNRVVLEQRPAAGAAGRAAA